MLTVGPLKTSVSCGVKLRGDGPPASRSTTSQPTPCCFRTVSRIAAVADRLAQGGRDRRRARVLAGQAVAVHDQLVGYDRRLGEVPRHRVEHRPPAGSSRAPGRTRTATG